MPGLPLPLGAGAAIPTLSQKSFRFRLDDSFDLNAPFGSISASDDFARTESSTWGNADLGGAWNSFPSSPNSVFGVGNPWGTMSVAANGDVQQRLNSVTPWLEQDILVKLKVSAIPVGGNLACYIYIRRQTGNDQLRGIIRFKPTGAITIEASKTIGGTTSTVSGGEISTGITPVANTVYWARVRATGASPTTLQVKLWEDGTAEPNTWPASGTVSDASVQVAGIAGLASFGVSAITNGPITVSWGNLEGVKIGDAATPALNANVSKDPAQTFRLRTVIQETGGAALADGYHLYASKNGGAYARVTAATDLRIVTSPQFVDGAATTNALGTGTGTFVAGEGDENAATGTISIPASGFTEIEWPLQIVNAAANDTFDLRVYRDDGTPLDAYTNTARATAASSSAQALEQNINDSLSVADAAALGFGEALADTLTLADLAALGPNRALADTLSLTDAVSLGPNRVLEDSLILADAIALGHGEGIADVLSLTDAAALGVGKGLTDSLSVSDDTSTQAGKAEAVDDSLTLSDAVLLSRGFGVVLDDPLALTDAVVFVFGRAVDDTLSLSDFAATAHGLNVSTDDSLSLTDAVFLGFGPSVADSLTVDDAVALDFGRALADTLGVSDEAAAALALAISAADSLSLNDAIASELGRSVSLDDLLSLSDDQQTEGGKGASIADSLTLSDALAFDLSQFLSDSLSVSDALGFSNEKSLFDVLSLSDSILTEHGLRALIGDALALSDDLSKQVVVAIIDPLVVADALSSAANFFIVTNDGISLADFADADLDVPASQYTHTRPPLRALGTELELDGIIINATASGLIVIHATTGLPINHQSSGLPDSYAAAGPITSATASGLPADHAAAGLNNHQASGLLSDNAAAGFISAATASGSVAGPTATGLPTDQQTAGLPGSHDADGSVTSSTASGTPPANRTDGVEV